MSKVEDFNRLKNRISELQIKKSKLETSIVEKAKVLKSILQKYGVSSVEELREKNRSSLEYADSVMNKVNSEVAQLESQLTTR